MRLELFLFSFFLIQLCHGVTVMYTTEYKNSGKGSSVVPAYIYLQDPPPSGPVPLIVFAHCYMGAGNWYDYIAEALVPQGYVMASLDTWAYDPIADAQAEALDQEFLASAVRQEAATNTTSPIYGMLTNFTALMGHSMGGGATIISSSAVTDSTFQALITLSAEYEPAASKVAIPAMILTGTEDCICPPDRNAIPIYNNISLSPCKYLINFVNATHCHFDEIPQFVDDFCEEVEKDCGPRQDWLPRETQWGDVNRYSLPFLDYYLKGKKDGLNTINSMLVDDAENNLLIYESKCSM